MSDTKQYANEVEKLQDGGSFWLGRIVKWHKLGEYDIAEYHPRAMDGARISKVIDTDTTNFAGYIDGRDASHSWSTLEQAIVGLIAIRRDGPNSQAGTFFCRMVRIEQEA